MSRTRARSRPRGSGEASDRTRRAAGGTARGQPANDAATSADTAKRARVVPEPTSPQPRWRLWSVRVLVGAFVTALLAWAALNAVHADEPRPLWGAAALPAPPAAQNNGWQRLYEHPDLFRGADTWAIHEPVRKLLDGPVDAPLPTDAERALLDAALQAAPIAAAWQICAESLAAPRFVDACPLDFEQRCPAMDVLGCHRVGAARVIGAAAERRWVAASAELDALLGQALGLLTSARSVVTEVAAFRATADALGLAIRLARWVAPTAQSEALEPLRQRVAALRDEQLRFESAAIGEYLLALSGVERMASGEIDTSGGALPRFFFDPGATVAELNRVYQPVHQAAFGLAVPDLPVEPHTASFGWWLRNPLGKLYLDVVLPPRGAFTQLLSARAELIRARDDAMAELVRAEAADVGSTESPSP